MFAIPFVQVTAVADDLYRRHARVIRKAIERSHGTLDAACIDMGVKPSNFSAELAGERTLRYAPLMLLGPQFWAWMAVFLALEFGVPSELRRAARFAMGIYGAKKLARVAALPQKRSA